MGDHLCYEIGLFIDLKKFRKKNWGKKKEIVFGD